MECPHSRLECECTLPPRSVLEEVMEFAEIANAAADLLVGHRSILISGGIDPAVVDQMIYNLHCKILGIADYNPLQYLDFIGEDEL